MKKLPTIQQLSTINETALFTIKQEIEEWVKKYVTSTGYTINNDLTVDIDTSIEIGVRLKHSGLYELPIIFGKVGEYMTIYGQNMVSLKGSPRKVGLLRCEGAGLQSLEGAPDEVDKLLVSSNKLTNMKGCSKKVNHIDCSSNSKTLSLIGCPDEIDSMFAYGSRMVTLEGCPRIVRKYFTVSHNKLNTLKWIPKKMGECNITHNNLVFPDVIKDMPNIVVDGAFKYSDGNTINIDIPKVKAASFE